MNWSKIFAASFNTKQIFPLQSSKQQIAQMHLLLQQMFKQERRTRMNEMPRRRIWPDIFSGNLKCGERAQQAKRRESERAHIVSSRRGTVMMMGIQNV
jgi:hypothetical protein